MSHPQWILEKIGGNVENSKNASLEGKEKEKSKEQGNLHDGLRLLGLNPLVALVTIVGGHVGGGVDGVLGVLHFDEEVAVE